MLCNFREKCLAKNRSKPWKGFTTMEWASERLACDGYNNICFDEIVTFFNSRSRHAKAVEIGNRLMSSRSVNVIHVDKKLFEKGWQYFQQHADKTYSMTDCISFIVMKDQGSESVLSFDKHFTQAGFTVLPWLVIVPFVGGALEEPKAAVLSPRLLAIG